jgi:putative glutamine amidotransferase
MQSTRPRVLVSRAEEVTGERWDDYADCLRRAGADPIAADLTSFDGIAGLPPFDGLLVTAGVDVDPARYGETRSDRVREVNPARDDFELMLFAEATRRNVPVLAICRGAQLLNVARGGSLVQHLEQREPHRARLGADGVSIDSGWHDVRVKPATLLARVTGGGTMSVNSRHHQAVTAERLAPGFVASAVAPDGVVEAFEDPAYPWMLGVQWHPERPELTANPAHAPVSMLLFEAFVSACRDSARERVAAVEPAR